MTTTDMPVWEVKLANDRVFLIVNKGEIVGQVIMSSSRSGFRYSGKNIKRFPKFIKDSMNLWMKIKCTEEGNNFGGIWDIGAWVEE